ncbi:MAG TPA: cation diffusion facilitator family transporter [Pyrinomonadaceae bacterium]|jgi:ferrous-iron efflux pump FieF|nr:cation diffusion facilitator family transporter [Pyrinomonadaceae bacterium]
MAANDAHEHYVMPGLSAEDARLKSSAARLSILAAGFLIILKTWTGWLTGSISVWASLLDSAMDIFASVINFYAVRAAARPPDEDHRYGHGKAESLAGLFQSAVITASGIFLVIEAVRRLFEPHEVGREWVGVATMVVAAAVSVFLVMRLRRTARATDSPAIGADAAHYATDVFTNAAALAALLIVALTGWRLADPLISLLISGFILYSAFDVGRDAFHVLMDRRLPRAIDRKVEEVVARFRDRGVLGCHDIRTRRSGSLKFIDLHLEVERDSTLEEAHGLTVSVLRAIEAEIPRSRVQIHTDPA